MVAKATIFVLIILPYSQINIIMPTILFPNYSITQIIHNYRTKSYRTDAAFIKSNFYTSNTYMPGAPVKTNTHKLSLSYLNSIIYDNGSGMLSSNINSLDYVQLNIINDGLTNLFFINNVSGFPILQFLNAPLNEASTMIASFLDIQQLFSVNISQFLNQLNALLNNIVISLKRKTFTATAYSTTLLNLIQTICKYLIRSNTY